MSGYICNFCKREFQTLNSLNKHKINAKYCLIIQGKKEDKKYNCDTCSVSFDTQYLLTKHSDKCRLTKIIEKLREEIAEKDLQITKLTNENNILTGKTEVYKYDQECLHKIAQQPKTTSNINHITNNLAIYDAELIANNFKNALNNITPEDICEGQIAVAKIIAPCLTNSDGMKMIACTDKSRGVFVMKDSNGKINKDIKAKKLVDTIEPIASMKVDEIVNLEKEKVTKSRELFTLKNNIKKRTEEIQNLEDTLCGFNKNSNEYFRLEKQIEQLHDMNNDEYEQIRVFEEEGVIEINYDIEQTNDLDTKLLIGATEIKDIKSNSNKFSTTLGNMV